jgi:peptidoglycan-associated lipoprotein
MMMRKMIIVLVALVFACSALFLMTSCAKKQVMTGAPEKKPPVVAPPPGDTEAYKRAEAERQARLAALAAAEGLRGQIRAFEAENINFDFDKSELKPEARAILVKKAEWLRNNSEFSVRIEGHCDERGTNEYNLALGERRANAAWKFLNALGISGSRMTTISYGEERPADPRHSETAWSKNRRDEFKLIR